VSTLRRAGFVFLALVGLLVGSTLAERLLFRGQVLPGVEVASATVAGDDERRALVELSELAQQLETRALRARGAGRSLSLAPAEIGYDVDAAATVRNARRAGRRGNPLAQVTGAVLRRFRPDEVELAVRWDDRRLDAVLDRWEDELAAGLENGGLRFEGAQVIEIAPTPGFGLHRREAKARLESALRAGDGRTVALPVGDADPAVDAADVRRAARRARRIVSAPFTLTVNGTVIPVAPEQVAAAMSATPDRGELVLGVDVTRLRAAIGPALAFFEVPPVDASWVVDGTTATVVPSASGRAVDLRPLADAVLREEHAATAPVVEAPPAFTTEAAQALNITEKVSEFTTNFVAGQARVQNIHRAADAVNNALVLPGQTFSLNDRLGPRRCEDGWALAPAFSTQEGFYQECGGGVSQFSTTLFNATFFGGYQDVSHTPHSIYISRYPLGREATLDYESIDNRFRNDSNSGVLIRTSYTTTSVTVAFYGSREGCTVRAEGPNVLEEIPVAVEYVDNPFLPAGTEQPVPNEPGYTGYKVENFRVTECAGQPPRRERFYWEYDMRPRKIFLGTANI
jgi:vancomycin resistance protein YoaR